MTDYNLRCKLETTPYREKAGVRHRQVIIIVEMAVGQFEAVWPIRIGGRQARLAPSEAQKVATLGMRKFAKHLPEPLDVPVAWRATTMFSVGLVDQGRASA